MKTKVIDIGGVKIGGGNPPVIQSMTNTDTRDVGSTLKQIETLALAGCELVRVAVVDTEAANAISSIVKSSKIPVIADIHFDHRLALLAMKNGVHALRLNPGNIKDASKIKEVISEARSRDIVIRVGVNAGSLDPKKYREPSAENMLKSAREHIRLMEDLNFTNIKVSLKSSDVSTTVSANRLFANEYDYPIHLGVTEAGTLKQSLVKSSIGIGTLLMEGIGDTLRVSITGDPIDEIPAAIMILKYSGRMNYPLVEIISCPSCGRTEFDIESLASELERRVSGIKKNVRVAVMGCPVNGPGEAKHADFGVAGRRDGSFLFFEGDNKAVNLSKDKVINFLTEKIKDF